MSTEKGERVMNVFAGIDVGGMSVKVGIFDGQARLLGKLAAATSKDDGYAVTVQKTVQAVKEACQKVQVPFASLRGAGVGAPGVIDGEKGVVVRWSNYGWENKPLAADLSAGLGVPVELANDANAAALGEARFGAGKKYNSSILLTIGTGIGSGIIIDGSIFAGFRGGGGEAGHMVIESGGIPCPCGRRGCFEQYASASALIRDTKRAMFEHKDSALWRVAVTPEGVDGRTAFTAAREGDAAARKVVDSFINYLADGIADLVNLFRPEAVLLGGGVSGEGEALLAPLRLRVGERLCVDAACIPFALLRAALGNDAGIYGGCALVSG